MRFGALIASAAAMLASYSRPISSATANAETADDVKRRKAAIAAAERAREHPNYAPAKTYTTTQKRTGEREAARRLRQMQRKAAKAANKGN